jgi:hypothetical protein
MLEEDENKLNDILISSELNTLSNYEVDILENYNFIDNSSYYSAINSILNVRKSTNEERKRFYILARNDGYPQSERLNNLDTFIMFGVPK